MDHKKDETSNFIERVGKQIARKIKAQRKQNNSLLGFGMFGLIGWSIALPIVLGTWFGIWLDEQYTSTHSWWTLIFLTVGLCIACWNIMRWIQKEHQDIQSEEEDE